MAYYNRKSRRWFKSKYTSNRADAGIRAWRRNQRKSTGAIATALLLLIELWFSIPDDISIAWIIVDTLFKGLNIIGFIAKILLNILGGISIYQTIKYIKKQANKGNL